MGNQRLWHLKSQTSVDREALRRGRHLGLPLVTFCSILELASLYGMEAARLVTIFLIFHAAHCNITTTIQTTHNFIFPILTSILSPFLFSQPRHLFSVTIDVLLWKRNKWSRMRRNIQIHNLIILESLRTNRLISLSMSFYYSRRLWDISSKTQTPTISRLLNFFFFS